MRASAIFSILMLSGCAAHKPALQTWRLTSTVLIPPGIAGPEVAKRTFTTDVVSGGGPCPSPVRVRGKRVQLTVSRETLLKQPDGWLTAWSEELEAQRCIAPGESVKLADRITESLPLDPNQAFRLLFATDRQSGQVDLGPRTRLQVVSPIMEGGAAFELPPSQTTGDGNTLTLTVQAPAGMLGYETALYEVQRRTDKPGYRIVPLSAERHINGKSEVVPQPATNYFQFSENASFYRLFYKAGQTDFTALVAGASTRTELKTSLASCDGFTAGMCIAIPRSVALNPLITITVNGSETLVNWNSTVNGAIRAAGSGNRMRYCRGCQYRSCATAGWSRSPSIAPTRKF